MFLHGWPCARTLPSERSAGLWFGSIRLPVPLWDFLSGLSMFPFLLPPRENNQTPSGLYFGLKISSWARVRMDVCMDLASAF